MINLEFSVCGCLLCYLFSQLLLYLFKEFRVFLLVLVLCNNFGDSFQSLYLV
jgi:hypothetical protein